MKIKIGLIWRIVIAIALAVILGMLLPKIPVIGEAFSEWFVRLAATFNMIFGGFLNFVVPLIIIGFIAPGIAKLGKGSGKLLGLRQDLPIFRQSWQGLLLISQQREYCLDLIGGLGEGTVGEASREAATAFFELEMIPIMDVMSALLLAFVLGIGMASIGSKTMLSVFDELNVLIEKVISVCYYSSITVPYFRDFSKYDVYG